MTDLIKEINMTNEGDISSMMKLLDYIDYKAGETVGIPKQLEGQIAEREGVQNVDKIFNTTLRLLEPYYQVHDQIKADVTAALVDFARAIYRKKQPTNLYYVLDDMSINWITHNTELFCMSQYGLFINNASNTLDALNKIGQITSLYAQNSSAKYSTLIKVSLMKNPTEASEYVQLAENEFERKQIEAQEREYQQNMALEKERQKTLEMQHKQAKELVILKESERRETEIQKAAIVAFGFFQDKDMNMNRIPDVVEQAKIYLAQKKSDQEDKKIKIMEQDSETKRMGVLKNKDSSEK